MAKKSRYAGYYKGFYKARSGFRTNCSKEMKKKTSEKKSVLGRLIELKNQEVLEKEN